jgi:hypothetical protein
MDAAVARNIAHYSHLAHRDRSGAPEIEHVERVAAAVPAEARATAFLHDVLEHTGTGVDDLRAGGLTDLELAALELLARGRDESFEAHALRIASAPGEAGDLARCVKLADLDDHLAQPEIPSGAPPYAWARRRISVAAERLRDTGRAA